MEIKFDNKYTWHGGPGRWFTSQEEVNVGEVHYIEFLKNVIKGSTQIQL